MIQNKWTTDGSGSTYIWGFMDEGFKVCFLCPGDLPFSDRRSCTLSFSCPPATSVDSFLSDKITLAFTVSHCLLYLF